MPRPIIPAGLRARKAAPGRRFPRPRSAVRSRLRNEYEALGPRPGGESAYTEGMLAYQQLLADHPEDARLHLKYGYLQECRGRNLIRAAVSCYERAIELDPDWDKPHYHLIFARSALVSR